MPNSRSRRLAYYGLPMLFCLAVHWLALKMWFFTDDFAWLGLRLEINTPADIVHVLFSPQAQGTVRTLSERLFFLVFSIIFGIESPPFRVWVFLTQFANIYLLIRIARRLTGSAAAGFLASLLWTANAGLARAIGQSAVYNEIAFAFVILLAFHLFLRYIDTGQLKYWIWQWVVFLLGFGILELNVIYPALAAGYALCCARSYLRRTLPLFIPSILFTAVHFILVPPPTDGYYKLHFDSGIFSTFLHYWTYALGALRDGKFDWRPLWLGWTTVVLITVTLIVFLFRKLRARNWLALFLLGWFVVALLPILPLTTHFTEYYLTVPAIGLSILAAWALTSSTRTTATVVAATLTCLYFALAIGDSRMTERYFYDRSRRMKYLIKGLESQQRIQPHPTILLSGIDNDLFWTGFCDDPFRLIGISRVYLVPGSEKRIEVHPEWGCNSDRFNLSPDDAVPLLRKHEAAVFELDKKLVRDVTQSYLAAASLEFAARHPEFVDLADPTYVSHLGPTWYPAEEDFRWMPKTGTVKIGGPQEAGRVLDVNGYCPAILVAQGPVTILFRADDVEIGTATLKQPDQRFNLQFPLPPELVGRPMVQIEIEVSRTTQAPGDSRDLGMVFTTFTIK